MWGEQNKPFALDEQDNEEEKRKEAILDSIVNRDEAVSVEFSRRVLKDVLDTKEYAKMFEAQKNKILQKKWFLSLDEF